MLTIGSDPEVFIRDKTTKEIISAHDIIPGTKDNPHSLGEGRLTGSVQADGTALEFNTVPASNPTEFITTHRVTISALQPFLPKNTELVALPSVVYPEVYFSKLPEKATLLGCEPDYDAYTGQMKPVPSCDEYPTLRTGAGHVHLGWRTDKVDVLNDDDHFNDCRILVQNLDKAFKWLNLEDPNDLRTKLYGGPGAFRPKPYGLEYRSPSNRWLRSHYTVQDVFNICRYTFFFTLKYGLDRDITQNLLNTRSINTDQGYIAVAKSHVSQDLNRHTLAWRN